MPVRPGPTLWTVEDDLARQRLSTEHERLERLRTSLENDHLHDEPEDDTGIRSRAYQHPADSASDALEREKEFSILEQVQAELAAVDRAPQRLDEGTYGTCGRAATASPMSASR